jgi:Cu(I)/Ag(I) efflux system membrane fusion protein
MKNKTTAIIALIALVIGLLMGRIFFGGTNDQNVHDHAVSDTINQKSEEIIFTCSMHPQIRKNEEGDCPICGMDLIPLAVTSSELDPLAVSMSAAAMQLAQVQTMVIVNVSAEKSLRLNGKVQADERLLFTQSSHFPGRIDKLGVNFTGDFVKEGQVIANIYSPALVTAQEELLQALKIKDLQPALFNAAKEKLKNWKLSHQQIEQIISSGQGMESFPILANVSGYVTKKMVNLGDYIKQGEAIYEIADLSKVWLLFDIYESDMSWVKKGNPISYTIPSLPGKTFTATINYVDPVIDPKTRVAHARVETLNRDLLLKPEMFATGIVEAKIQSETPSLTVPKTAVMWTGKRSVVYILQKSDQQLSFKMRLVNLGPELGNSYLIESGLEAGEEIAVHGTFSIDAAAQLAGKPSMMNPQGGEIMRGHNHGVVTNLPAESTASIITKNSLSTDAKNSLVPLFKNYFKMKEALVNDDFHEAKKAGEAIHSALGKIDMQLFTGEAHTLWMKHSHLLKNNTEHIEHQKDLAVLRETFLGISRAMIAISESFDPLSVPLYVQHCPMADSFKGADWLSKKKEILNPYFGQSMLTCGSITKTIE